MDAAKGSIRRRGTGSFELRVYGGTDPVSGRRSWLTRTVRGDRSDALRELKALTAHANIAPAVGAHTTVAALARSVVRPRSSEVVAKHGPKSHLDRRAPPQAGSR